MTYIHTHGRSTKIGVRAHAVRPVFYIGRVSLMFMLMMLIALLGVVYLVNFNSKATAGYELSRLEFQREKLLNVREQKNLDLSRSQSLDYIKDSRVINGMVPIGPVVFYDGDTAVALR